MKLISSDQYSIISDELNEFFTICNKYQYTPTKFDYEDIIKFLLLYHGDSTGLCESDVPDFIQHLSESKVIFINEDTTYDPKGDLDSATGLAIAGGAVALGTVTVGAIAIGDFIKYLFKKGKVKKSVAKETQAELQKLKDYQRLAELKKKISELGGEDVGKIEIPGMAKGGDLEVKSSEK